jgi:hypothetical protein
VGRSKKAPTESRQFIGCIIENERQTTPQLADVLG